jgi:hypothetical protein
MQSYASQRTKEVKTFTFSYLIRIKDNLIEQEEQIGLRESRVLTRKNNIE